MERANDRKFKAKENFSQDISYVLFAEFKKPKYLFSTLLHLHHLSNLITKLIKLIICVHPFPFLSNNYHIFLLIL